MITMNFEELQKIWDTQNNEPLYAINEKAMHKYIISKRNQAGHITNISELLSIVVNFAVAAFVAGMQLVSKHGNIFMYLMAAWVAITACYVLVNRRRRLKGQHNFERSLLGDLNHAIAMATYQVRLSQLLRWNILPIGLFILLSFWEGEKPLWTMTVLLLFVALTYFASGWEHNIYRSRKRELEVLQKRLETQEKK
jgi:hypothetical protein